MDGIADLFKPDVLLPLLTFAIPGFIAWATMQSILPRGSQKVSEVGFEILTYGFVNAILWTLLRKPPSSWQAWPTSWSDDLLFVAMVIASPIVIAVLYLRLLRWLVKRRQILPLEPTAWDWLFLDSAKNARAAVITLRDNTKVAGAFVEGSYTALHPYARDLFLSEVWKLNDDGRFVARVAKTQGLYIDKSDILYIEFFDYEGVIESARRLEAEREK